MFYYNQRLIDNLYLDGKRITLACLEGDNIYYDPHGFPGILKDIDPDDSTFGYLFTGLNPSSPITNIEWANSIPDGVNVINISRKNPEGVNLILYMFSDFIRWNVDLSRLSIYDENKVYSVGDVVVRWRTHDQPLSAYTCVFDMQEPEEWNSTHWKSGVHSDIFGSYDSTSTYSEGQVVCRNLNLYTCIHDIDTPEEWNDDHWYSGDYPGLTSYDETKQYNVGDVVVYTPGGAYAPDEFTCIKSCRYLDPFRNPTYWKRGYYRGLLGEYNRNTSYRRGDTVLYNNTVRTCVAGSLQDVTPPTTGNDDYWISRYAPYIKEGQLTSLVQTYIGATVVQGSYGLMSLYPMKPYSPIHSLIYAWVEGQTIKLYSENHTLRAHCRFALYTSDMIGPDLGSNAQLRILSDFDLSNTFSLYKCFYKCGYIGGDNLLYVASWDVRHVVFFDYCFAECNNGWFTDLFRLQSWDTESARSMSHMFYNCSILKYINYIKDWNLSKVENLSYMFAGCSSLIIVNGFYINWDLSNAKDMSHMFQNCTSLTNINFLSNWHMPKVKNLSYMFDGCTSLIDVDGLHWDLSNVTDYSYMFSNCTSLKVIRELYWTNMKSVPIHFKNCTALIKADFSRFSSQNGMTFSTDSSLFEGCSKLEKCDLGELYTSASVSITYSTGPFSDCSKLSLLIIRNTSAVFSRMITASWGSDGLDNLIRNNGKIYVPQNLLSDYQSNSAYQSLIAGGVQILPLEGSPYEQPGSL